LSNMTTSSSTQTKPSSAARKPSVLQGSDGLMLNGRALSIVLAVTKTTAQTLQKQNSEEHQKQDKRHLYLAEEGLIVPNTTAAIGLTSLELDRRMRYYK